jgi:hypothetical protein
VSLPYDSIADTRKHSDRVRQLLSFVSYELTARGRSHDASKMREPELSIFNEFTPKLKTSTFGSEEYKGHLAAMGEGLVHHYAHNSHHPEHFPEGVDGMTLIDLLEMLMDWKAATERHDNGDISRSIRLNAERFHMAPQLVKILDNTIVALDLL